MTWPKYVLLAWFALAAVLSIATFERPTPKKTAQLLAIGLLIQVALAALVVLA